MNSTLRNTILIGLMIAPYVCFAQTLDTSKEFIIKLSDSTDVKIYKKVDGFDAISDEYYYLPSHLKFSLTKSKEPEFSLLMYSDRGGNHQGGILHFLATWGLTLEQRNEAEAALRTIQGDNARLMGAVTPELDEEQENLTIKGTSPLVDILNKSATTIGRVPTFSHSKTASSFKLNNDDAQTLKIAIDNNTEDLKNIFLSMNFIIKFKGEHDRVPNKEDYTLEQNLYKLLNTQL